MKSEMDLMRMDERQRLSWLKANRATLIVVGIVWLALIAREYAEGRTPAFLVVMVPVFAATRLALYWYYARDRDTRWPYRLLFFATAAAAHLVATISSAMGEMLTGGIFGLFRETNHAAWSTALRILEFPLLTIVRLNDPHRMSAYGWVMVLNSLLWAGGIYLIVRLVARRRSDEGPDLGIAP